MGELLIFVFAAWTAYAAGCGLIGIFAPSPNARGVPTGRRRTQTDREWHRDLASRLLLGLGDDSECQSLRDKSQTDPAFAAELDGRRYELIRAYASGQVNGDLRDAFRQRLLQLPGVAAEVEVERVLIAATAADYDNLHVRISYRMDRVEALWRRLTLPRPPVNIQSADGPCLMIRPAMAETDPPGLEGRVTGIEGERTELDIGLHHGLGPGDVVQFGTEADGQWIGAGVIESAKEASSTALWMGEQPPRIGDRAIANLYDDLI